MSLPRYEQYKDSGVEWLGKVPAHWDVVALGKLTLSRCDGPFGSSLKSEHYTESGVRVVRLQNIRLDGFSGHDEAFVDPEYCAKELSGHDVAEDDLLIAGLGDENNTVGRACVAPSGIEPAIVKADCFRFRLDPNRSSPHFVAASLNAGAVADAGVLSSGSTRSRIPLSVMASRRLALPPIPEQLAIGAFLDRETAKIDALVAEQRRLIELLDAKYHRLVYQSVTKGINLGVEVKPSGIPWIGEIPVRWATPPFFARYQVVLGKMLDERRLTGAHPLPYLRNADVNWDRVNFENLPLIDIAPHERDRFTLRSGDLLICEGGAGVGQTAIWKGEREPCAFQKALHRLRPWRPGEEEPRFHYYCMRYAVEAGVILSGGTATIPHLTGEQLRRYRFPRPPVEEQREIVDFLDRVVEKMDALKAETERAIGILNERRIALVSAAVTGQIDVRSAVQSAG